MIRTAARKAALLAATTLFAGAVSVNCSNNAPETNDTIGSVALELTLPNGQQLNTVTYEVRNSADVVVRSGSIDVSGTTAKPSVLLVGLTPGTYKATMKGDSVDGTTKCSGEATFQVFLGMTTQVDILMQCRQAGTTGDAVLNGRFNTCPVIDSVAITPLETDVGKTIDLKSTAHDPDCVMLSGTTCTAFEAFFSDWSASGGADPTPADSANATYTCSVAGTHTLTLTVFDKNADGSTKCPVTYTRDILCKALSCGNNIKEPAQGEECDGTDTPAGQMCSTNCTIIPVCGNNIKEAGEDCDSAAERMNNTCTSMCKSIAISCGNGLVQPGEQCDPPAMGSCSATCQNVQPTCGDGVVNQTSEQCDLGAQNGVPGSGCSATCQTQQTCAECEAAGAANPATSSECSTSNSGCSGFTGTDKTLCEALVACIRSTGCADDATGDAQACYCGTASVDDCLAGGANGMCKTQSEMAAKSTSPITIAGRFSHVGFPIGRAFNLMICDVVAGCGPTGSGVCPL